MTIFLVVYAVAIMLYIYYDKHHMESFSDQKCSDAKFDKLLQRARDKMLVKGTPTEADIIAEQEKIRALRKKHLEYEQGNSPMSLEEQLEWLTYQNELGYDEVAPQTLTDETVDYPYYVGSQVTIDGPGRRDCAVYYTKLKDLCDQYSHFYNLPAESLQARSASSPSVEEAKAASEILTEVRANPDMSTMGACRINFRNQGWTEPTMTTDGQKTVPVKNTKDEALMSSYDDPLNWARCYKPRGNRTATQVLNEIADDKTIVGNVDPQSPFQSDSAEYAEMRFASLDFTALNRTFCAARKSAPSGIPGGCFRFLLTTGLTPTILGMTPVTLNNQTLKFDAASDRAAFLNLYTRRLNKTRMMMELVPRKLSCQIYVVYWDSCGRVDKFEQTSTALSLSDLVTDIQPVALEATPSTSDVTYGEYEELKTRLLELQRRFIEESNTTFTLSTRVSYAPGLIAKEYIVPGTPSMNNANEITNVLSSRTTTLVRTEFNAVMPGFDRAGNRVFTSTSRGATLWIWEGFLLAPITGSYYFYINSDDAADVLVNGQNVANYYGYHGNYNQGTSLNQGIRISEGQYASIVIRVHNGGGPGHISVYWNAGGSTDRFVYIPKDAYFLNSNVLAADTATSKAERTKTDRDVLQQHINRIDTKSIDEADKTLSRVLNKRFMGNAFNAKYLSGIDPDKKQERYVFINFTAITVDQPPPPTNMYSSAVSTFVLQSAEIQLREKWIDIVPALPPSINFRQTPVKYTYFMNLYVEKIHTGQRNIFQISDNYSLADMVPSLMIAAGTNKLRLLHASTLQSDDGFEFPTFFDLGRWFVLAVSVNDNRITGYINGANPSSRQVSSSGRFVWNFSDGYNLTNRKLTLNLLNKTSSAADSGSVIIKNFEWSNEALSQASIVEVSRRLMQANSLVPTTLEPAVVQIIPTANNARFYLIDNVSGNYVTYGGSTFTLNSVKTNATIFQTYSASAVFKNNEGGVALNVVGGPRANNGFMRHSGFTCYSNNFASNNYDFAWRFDQASQVNTFTIFNWYGSPNFYLDAPNGTLAISGNTSRRVWRLETAS